MILKNYKGALVGIVMPITAFFAITQTGCKMSYGFHDAKSIPDSVKIVKINQVQNKAAYVNPALAPALTDKIRQKIVSQTRLTQTTADDADWEISTTVTNYSFSTAGISNQQVNTNRLNVGVHIEIKDGHTQKILRKYDVTTPFDYSGSLGLQQAEQGLQTQMLRDIPDAIFNRIFSNW